MVETKAQTTCYRLEAHAFRLVVTKSFDATDIQDVEQSSIGINLTIAILVVRV